MARKRGLVRTGIAIGLPVGTILRASETTPNIWFYGVFLEMEHRVSPPREPRFQLSRKPFNSTRTFHCLIGADRTKESVNPARARAVRFMNERMMMLENICLMENLKDPSGREYDEPECVNVDS